MALRVLVTGGSGHLGRILERCVDSGSIELTMLDLRPHQPWMLKGDIVDPDFMREAVVGYDAVVHAAALHGVHVGSHPFQHFLRTNVEGAGNVFSACVAAGVKRIVVMSSTSVYGLSARRPSSRTVFVDETTPCHPIDVNDLSKVLVEELAAYTSRQNDIPVTVLRSGRFFVGDTVEFNIAKLTGAVDAVDVAQAVVRSLLVPSEGFNVYCVASSTRFSATDGPALSVAAAEVIEERYPGATSALATYNRSLPERLHRVVTIDKARDAMGYAPSENFDRFIERLAREQADTRRTTAASDEGR